MKPATSCNKTSTCSQNESHRLQRTQQNCSVWCTATVMVSQNLPSPQCFWQFVKRIFTNEITLGRQKTANICHFLGFCTLIHHTFHSTKHRLNINRSERRKSAIQFQYPLFYSLGHLLRLFRIRHYLVWHVTAIFVYFLDTANLSTFSPQ